MLLLPDERGWAERYAFYALMHEANMAYTNACLPVLEFLSSPAKFPPPLHFVWKERTIERHRLGVRNVTCPSSLVVVV